ncbi:MAG: excinuclease ABC subunit UvrC [Anaerolineales bacterium]
MNASTHIEARLAGVPQKPGVYLMRDANDDVIYVGKAVVLRDRVRSYFRESAAHTAKTRRLVSEVDDLEWIVTESELEALILESQLIKRYRPRYNVRLKDDKRYPYIKVSLQEDFPRIHMVRKMMRDGARYFGPFTSSRAVRQSLDLLRRLFPYRTCDREITGEDSRPCLYYHIDRCGGPCIGAVDRQEYRATIERACLFLEGKQEQIIEEMRTRMEDAAETLDFETAADLRDQLSAIEHVIQQQRIVSGHLRDHDFIAFARDEREACVQVFFVRGGRLIGREYFLLTGADEEDDAEIMTSFVKQFYEEAAQVPPEILVQNDLDELAVIQRWLRRKRGDRVLIRVPKRGEKKDVMRMAVENAVETLKKVRAEWDADTNKQTQALAELQEALDLEQPPTRIECYDISNTQGVATTGSRVVFVKGVPSKQDYRRFRVRTVHGPDDYAAMAEVLQRRFKRAHEAQAKKREEGKESRWAIMPDLVLLDGGKGQLNAAREVMKELGVDHIPTAALAKREEALFVPGRSAPILLPRRSEGLYLLQRIRDEAHRFAINYHRKLRRKKGMNSILEEIPGVGPVRRQSLLKTFGSLEGVREATVEELAAAPSMTRPVAERLREYL